MAKNTDDRDILYACLVFAAIIGGLLVLWAFSIDGGSTGLD